MVHILIYLNLTLVDRRETLLKIFVSNNYGYLFHLISQHLTNVDRLMHILIYFNLTLVDLWIPVNYASRSISFLLFVH